MQGKKMVDYRNFRFSKLNTPEFQHLKYLVFWPVFGVLFLIVERLWIRDHYTSIHCSLDDLIPFCECFLILYLFWFALLIGIVPMRGIERRLKGLENELT